MEEAAPVYGFLTPVGIETEIVDPLAMVVVEVTVTTFEAIAQVMVTEED